MLTEIYNSVHRRLRHRGPEGGQGAARGVERFRLNLMTIRGACFDAKPGIGSLFIWRRVLRLFVKAIARAVSWAATLPESLRGTNSKWSLRNASAREAPKAQEIVATL